MVKYVCTKCGDEFKKEKQAENHVEKGKCKGAIYMSMSHFGSVLREKDGW